MRTAAAQAAVLFLHGYPSSSYDWRHLLDLLPGHELACFDFLGFGLSEKPRDHVYSLLDQADLVEGSWTGSTPTGSCWWRTTWARRSPPSCSPATSRGGCPPAAFGAAAQRQHGDRAGQPDGRPRRCCAAASAGWRRRLSNERSFRAQFGRLFSPDHPLTPEEAADQWALLAHGGGNRILHRLTHYLHERVTYAERWHGALRDWGGQLELAWGMRDPVATGAVLDAVVGLRPHAPRHALRGARALPAARGARAVAPVVARVAGTPLGGRPAQLRLNALRQAGHDEVVGVLDHVEHEPVGHAAVDLDGVPVALVEVVAGADRRVGVAQLLGERGLAFEADRERASFSGASANTLPGTLKTERSGRKGNSSVVPGRSRQRRRSCAAGDTREATRAGERPACARLSRSRARRRRPPEPAARRLADTRSRRL